MSNCALFKDLEGPEAMHRGCRMESTLWHGPPAGPEKGPGILVGVKRYYDDQCKVTLGDLLETG